MRVTKIYDLIAACELGIHDILRTESSPRSGLPRFNMPLELGLFLGARHYGPPKQRRKRCLVLDREKFRYQAYLSDIAGQDIADHGGDPARAVAAVRDWLSHFTPDGVTLPGGKKMAERYALFRRDLPASLAARYIVAGELIYNDFTTLLVEWLRTNPWRT